MVAVFFVDHPFCVVIVRCGRIGVLLSLHVVFLCQRVYHSVDNCSAYLVEVVAQ